MLPIEVVVLLISPTAGKDKVLLLAVMDKMSMDEGTVIIRVYPQKRKGQPGSYLGPSLENSDLGSVPYSLSLGPTRGSIGAIKKEAAIPLHKARPTLLSLRKGPDLNLML